MQQDEVQIPTEALKPVLSGDDILVDLLRDSYGLTVTDIKPLNGYDDLNFHVKVNPTHCNPHLGQVSPDGFFLKIINLQDSQRPDYLNAQVKVMEHLLKKGIQCQTTIKSINGELFTKCRPTTQNKNNEDISYLVTLRSFIPGQILHQVALTPDFLYRLGQYVADVTSALQDFYDPFYDTFDCTWSLNSVPKLTNIMFAVKDTSLRQICEEVVQKFQEVVTLLKSGFRRGQIHGDFNEQNILVNFALSSTETTELSSSDDTSGVSSLDGDKVHVCGLLDFQDTAFSYPLFDLAILVCYMLMTYSEVPLLDIPGYILAGYESKFHLTDNERAAFRTCVAARMVQSLAMGAYTHYMDPSNDYVLTTGKHGWRALETFWSADKEQSEERWDNIVRTFKPRPIAVATAY